MSEFKVDSEIQKLCDSFGSWFQEGCKNQAGNAAKMTGDLYPYTSIFSPIRVNRLTIKNRVVRTPVLFTEGIDGIVRFVRNDPSLHLCGSSVDLRHLEFLIPFGFVLSEDGDFLIQGPRNIQSFVYIGLGKRRRLDGEGLLGNDWLSIIFPATAGREQQKNA